MFLEDIKIKKYQGTIALMIIIKKKKVLFKKKKKKSNVVQRTGNYVIESIPANPHECVKVNKSLKKSYHLTDKFSPGCKM